ncbi:MAG: hypothetical protein EOP37_01570 [Rubrivivax sp.]|nr:MAG: hypothetical protein EOP37_01570 [Rubrivivax sp.]
MSISLLAGFAAPLSHAAALSTDVGLKCERAARPLTVLDADGKVVAGDVTVNARFAQGQVEQVEFVSGRAELLPAAQETLRQYRCDKAAPPRGLTMTLSVVDPKVPMTFSHPKGDPRNVIEAHNRSIRSNFPTRIDALFNLAETDPARLKNVAIVREGQLEISPEEGAHLRGRFHVLAVFLVDTDGKTSDIVFHSDAPQAVFDIVGRALRRSSFRPATYDGVPYPSVAEREYRFEIE